MPQQPKQKVPVQITNLICDHFDLTELNDLCFSLGVEYEYFPNERRGRARELVRYFDRRNRLGELIEECKNLRPDVEWPNLKNITEGNDGPPYPHPPAPLERFWAQLRRLLASPRNIGFFVAFLLLGLAIAISLPQIVGNNSDKTPTPSPTRPSVVGVAGTPEQPQSTTPAPTFTLTATSQPSVAVETPTVTSSPKPSATATPSRTATPTGTPTPTLDPNLPPSNAQLGDQWTRPSDNMTMIYVPHGTFQMGSDPQKDSRAFDSEFPQHVVTLSNYWLDRTEITNTQFAIFVSMTGHETTAEKAGGGYIYVDNNWMYVSGANWQQPLGENSNINNLENHPVVLVSWNDADAYCRWAGGGLPTEAQWEYAARNNSDFLYPWGNESPDCTLAQLNNCGMETVPVGTFSPKGDSWVGIADMIGNVSEWVSDWRGPYNEFPTTDPKGPNEEDSDGYKVLRGGSWNSDPVLYPGRIRIPYRGIAGLPPTRYSNIGFRCAFNPSV